MIVKIKVNANIKFEITNFGYIKACFLLDSLYKNEHITKRIKNVTESLNNILYDNQYIVDHAEYDMLTNEVILYLKNIQEVENE